MTINYIRSKINIKKGFSIIAENKEIFLDQPLINKLYYAINETDFMTAHYDESGDLKSVEVRDNEFDWFYEKFVGALIELGGK